MAKIIYDPKQIMEFWCNRWNFKTIPELRYENLRGMEGTLAEDKSHNPVIILDESYKPEENNPFAQIRLLHELRHYFQSLVYKRVFEWWITREDDYSRWYKSPVCVIEEDANIFSWSRGQNDGTLLLREFNRLILNGKLLSEQAKRTNLPLFQTEINQIIAKNNLGKWKSTRDEFVKSHR